MMFAILMYPRELSKIIIDTERQKNNTIFSYYPQDNFQMYSCVHIDLHCSIDQLYY